MEKSMVDPSGVEKKKIKGKEFNEPKFTLHKKPLFRLRG